MGFRFRKRLKLFPGFWLNFSKSGVSASAGVPGLTWNSRGRVTAGIPGTGISYVEEIGSKPKSVRERRQAQSPRIPSTIASRYFAAFMRLQANQRGKSRGMSSVKV